MHEVVLQFHDKRHANRVMRNLQKGKGVLIKPEHVGGGWFSGISGKIGQIASNPIVQRIGEKALDKGVNMAENYINNKLSGQTGKGLLGNIGNALGNTLDERFGIGLEPKKRRGRPKKGDGLLGNIGNALGNTLDERFGIGIKPKRKGFKVPRAMELYNHPNKRGGSMVPL